MNVDRHRYIQYVHRISMRYSALLTVVCVDPAKQATQTTHNAHVIRGFKSFKAAR